MTNELTMTDGQHLLRRILECPEDDAVRLIYSDCLEEQGDDWDIDAARNIRWAVAHPKESAVCLCVQSIKVNGRACELCRTHKIDMPKKKFGTDSPYVMNRGFVRSVSLTCAAFVGGPCPACDGRPKQTRFRGPGATNPYLYDCEACSGTGRIEGVARELFQRHPITEVRLMDRKPYTTPSGTIVWLRYIPPVDSYIPKELHKHMEQWSWFMTESDANAALSRACVDYGRNLVGLPPL